MDSTPEPYLCKGRKWSAWLEFPADMASVDALIAVADRLCCDFGAVVIERYPDRCPDDNKRYWRRRLGSETLLLMLKPPWPVALGVESGNTALLVNIARAWGVRRFIGWRWFLWRPWRWVVGRYT